MLRNKIGPVFNARNGSLFFGFFFVFFWKILFFLQGEWDFKKQKKNKTKKIGPVFNTGEKTAKNNLDQFLTLDLDQF